jgi:hypothetical protein
MKSFVVSIFVLLVAFCTTGSAQSDPLARTSRWSVEESWNNDKLVYTFHPNGSFTSLRMNDNRTASGTWIREGSAFLMKWPTYQATYLGTIGEKEI